MAFSPGEVLPKARVTRPPRLVALGVSPAGQSGRLTWPGTCGYVASHVTCMIETSPGTKGRRPVCRPLTGQGLPHLCRGHSHSPRARYLELRVPDNTAHAVSPQAELMLPPPALQTQLLSSSWNRKGLLAKGIVGRVSPQGSRRAAEVRGRRGPHGDVNGGTGPVTPGMKVGEPVFSPLGIGLFLFPPVILWGLALPRKSS